MNKLENQPNKMKTFLRDVGIYLGKTIVKMSIVILIGAVISFAVYYIKGYEIGTVMRIVGVIIGCMGLASQLGESGMRRDYNYNMAKMRDSKMLENEHNGQLTSGSLSFLIWMGTSGTILFLIGDALLRA